ncbi:hypothetical protein EG329_007569 [Mollisiaceae sp. DMI_Dod_QoI]|nr:hypothetical protein EG329_007569 [Helotiales sp. DMI_Dod_QoI]
MVYMSGKLELSTAPPNPMSAWRQGSFALEPRATNFGSSVKESESELYNVMALHEKIEVYLLSVLSTSIPNLSDTCCIRSPRSFHQPKLNTHPSKYLLFLSSSSFTSSAPVGTFSSRYNVLLASKLAVPAIEHGL